jgi:hypothetical protein
VKKIAQNVARNFWVKKALNLYLEKSSLDICASFVIYQYLPKATPTPGSRKFAQSGVNFMIMIFCDF